MSTYFPEYSRNLNFSARRFEEIPFHVTTGEQTLSPIEKDADCHFCLTISAKSAFSYSDFDVLYLMDALDSFNDLILPCILIQNYLVANGLQEVARLDIDRLRHDQTLKIYGSQRHRCISTIILLLDHTICLRRCVEALKNMSLNFTNAKRFIIIVFEGKYPNVFLFNLRKTNLPPITFIEELLASLETGCVRKFCESMIYQNFSEEYFTQAFISLTTGNSFLYPEYQDLTKILWGRNASSNIAHQEISPFETALETGITSGEGIHLRNGERWNLKMLTVRGPISFSRKELSITSLIHLDWWLTRDSMDNIQSVAKCLPGLKSMTIRFPKDITMHFNLSFFSSLEEFRITGGCSWCSIALQGNSFYSLKVLRLNDFRGTFISLDSPHERYSIEGLFIRRLEVEGRYAKPEFDYLKTRAFSIFLKRNRPAKNVNSDQNDKSGGMEEKRLSVKVRKRQWRDEGAIVRLRNEFLKLKRSNQCVTPCCL